MNEPQRVENPAEAFEKMRQAMGRILSASKKEIVRREMEHKEHQKAKRKKAA
jgi:hypothetical protein